MREHKKKIKIDKENVKKFFSGRGKRLKGDPITAVLYQDNNPELAHQRDKSEKEKILPMLNITSNDVVLDIACGIGRWAESLYDKIDSYVGIDFEDSFIEYANEKFKDYKNLSFKQLNALSISEKTLGRKDFNKVIITGLLIYLNDDEVRELFIKLKEVITDDSVIYLREPIGIEDRLSLSNFYSKDLNQEYSAIYRTRDELLELINPKEIIFEGDMYKNTLNNRSETKQYYFLFRIK